MKQLRELAPEMNTRLANLRRQIQVAKHSNNPSNEAPKKTKLKTNDGGEEQQHRIILSQWQKWQKKRIRPERQRHRNRR